MGKLRYYYQMEETEVEKSTSEQGITEQELQKLLEWQKGKGRIVRILEGKTKEGAKWIKGLPSNSRRVNAVSEEESEEESTKKEAKDKEQQEENVSNSRRGWHDWSEWKKLGGKGETEHLKREREEKNKEETEGSTRTKRAMSSHL